MEENSTNSRTRSAVKRLLLGEQIFAGCGKNGNSEYAPALLNGGEMENEGNSRKGLQKMKKSEGGKTSLVKLTQCGTHR